MSSTQTPHYSDARLPQALLAALPIMLGYLPVAIAFGAAGVAHQLSGAALVTMSALVLAGASQFVLMTTLASGGSWLWVVGLCALMDFRHLFYGAILRQKIPFERRWRFLSAFFLTDEVFATALTRSGYIHPSQRERWMLQMGVAAYLVWVLGTALGAIVGSQLSDAYPAAMQAMLFSLPALFLLLSYECANAGNLPSLLASALVTALCLIAGEQHLALPLGGFSGALVAFIRPSNAAAIDTQEQHHEL
ncbi:AzlC family ABC transporter permease [Carnimonas bestiolae]|uniref:AzlC family ABC transporter permease n=1 Tax=Carnimonas bestiolae TaxID=3402172 RepID=UPI003EDBBA4F